MSAVKYKTKRNTISIRYCRPTGEHRSVLTSRKHAYFFSFADSSIYSAVQRSSRPWWISSTFSPIRWMTITCIKSSLITVSRIRSTPFSSRTHTRNAWWGSSGHLHTRCFGCRLGTVQRVCGVRSKIHGASLDDLSDLVEIMHSSEKRERTSSMRVRKYLLAIHVETRTRTTDTQCCSATQRSSCRSLLSILRRSHFPSPWRSCGNISRSIPRPLTAM